MADGGRRRRGVVFGRDGGCQRPHPVRPPQRRPGPAESGGVRGGGQTGGRHADVDRLQRPAGRRATHHDNSVDPFRAEFQSSSSDFAKLSADAKVTTKATANVAAVQSATADSAVVLVAATSTVTNADGVAEPPRSWQLRVELQRDADRIKMSKVDFLQ
ncbi:hypothetical protein [Mycolicibacterium vanbaalenii]|uniref:hypothetical protein n=1 Tax=Mycolicibacterium vanbaalenii TaxID=110539 RepID=UPI0021F2C712|nr:hypothetical protein [Mycolicibacterium vanbaalenii]